MTTQDVALVERWLVEPGVARWWLDGTTVAEELADIEASLRGDEPTHLLVAYEGERPIGWCQWYLLADDPEFALDVRAQPGDVGIDYGIGEPDCRGRGVGTALIAALVRRVRDVWPQAGVIADPHAKNAASRRVLEKNGFALKFVAELPSETTDAPMAIYRLPGRAP